MERLRRWNVQTFMLILLRSFTGCQSCTLAIEHGQTQDVRAPSHVSGYGGLSMFLNIYNLHLDIEEYNSTNNGPSNKASTHLLAYSSLQVVGAEMFNIRVMHWCGRQGCLSSMMIDPKPIMVSKRESRITSQHPIPRTCMIASSCVVCVRWPGTSDFDF